MNETIKRLCEIKKYYSRPGGQCCVSQTANIKYIKSLNAAIKALELLPNLVSILENEHRYHDIECPTNCSKCDTDNLIHKAKELIGSEGN